MNKVKTIIKPRTSNYIQTKTRKSANSKKIIITSANKRIYKEISR